MTAEFNAGETIIFSIEPEHWDALDRDGISPRYTIVLSNGQRTLVGELMELLDRPRVAMRVDEAFSIQ